MMNVLADVPMRLIVSDAPVSAPASGWVWYVWALWIGLAILVIAAAAVFRRWVSRPKDPYERLFARVCEAAGVSTSGRTKLLMRAGGDAREALGQTMLRAMRGGPGRVSGVSGAPMDVERIAG